MSYNAKRMVPGSLLTASVVTYYTVPAGVQIAVVKEITLCNVSNATQAVNLYVVPSGGANANGNAEFYGLSIQANETKIFPRTSAMDQGSTIQANCSNANTVAMSVSGYEIT